MSWMLPAAISKTCLAFLLVLINGNLCYIEKRKFFLIWSYGWAFSFFRYFVMIIDAQLPAWHHKAQMLSILGYTLGIISATIIVYGTYSFYSRKFNHLWSLAGLLEIIWAVIGSYTQLNVALRILPIYAYLSYSFIWTGVMFWKHVSIYEVGEKILAVIYILFGASKLIHPMLGLPKIFIPIYYTSGLLLMTLILVGILITYLGKNKLSAEELAGKFQLIFETAPEFIVLLDRDGVVIDCNNKITELSGYKKEEVIGRHGYMFLQSDNKDFTRGNANKVVTQGIPSKNEYIMLRKDKRPINVSISTAPILDFKGSCTGMISIVENITESKQKYKRESAIKSIFSKLNNFIDLKETLTAILVDLKVVAGCENVGIRLENEDDYPFFVYDGFPDSFINRENSICTLGADGSCIACQNSDGYELECMCGNIIKSRCGGKLEHFTEKGSFWTNDSSSLVVDRNDGYRGYCIDSGYKSMGFVPLKASKKIIGLIYFCDLSVGKFSGDIIEYLEMLGEHIGIAIENNMIYSELTRAKLEAEAANKAKTVFLANMSHEMRTPLNGIVGMAQLTMLAKLTDEQRYNLNIIMDCSNSLLKVINDILDFSKIEAGKITFENEPFEIRKVVGEAIYNCLPFACKKGLDLDCQIGEDIPQDLLGDAARLKQVLNNLIHNAIKFTESGKILTKIERGKENKGTEILKFTIEDTGIGISDNERQYLFKSFSQVDASSTRQHGGTGLGLAICKQLVENMGGEIWVESEKHVGSKFIFTCKFEKVTESYDHDIDLPYELDALGLRILAVEDDESSQVVLYNMLQKMGNSVEIVGTGKEAIDLLYKQDFDAILMDIQLPQMDGLQTTAIIRELEHSSGKQTPIIAVTAHALMGDKERFLSAGMNDYISKPIDIKSLHILLKKYSGSKPQNSFINDSYEKYQLLKELCAEKDINYNTINNRTIAEKVGVEAGKIKNAIAQQDFIAIETSAHEVKRLAEIISAGAIKNIAFKMKFAARRKNINDITELTELMASEIIQFKQYGSESNENTYCG